MGFAQWYSAGMIAMVVLPAVVGGGNVSATNITGVQIKWGHANLSTIHTQVFFRNIFQSNVALILHPDPFVMKEMPTITPPSETVMVYIPLYPAAKSIAPVSNIADMGTPLDADLVDGSLYFTSQYPEKQIQSWYAKQFQKLGYKVNGWGQSNVHGKTVTAFVEFSKNGMPGHFTNTPDINLGFLTHRLNGQTVFKLKASYIITPSRPKDSYLPTDISRVVLTSGKKSKIITNPAWISHVIGQINALQVTTPAIMSVPTVVNGMNLTVKAKFYEIGAAVMDVEFLLPTSVVKIGNVIVTDTITLEKEIQAVRYE